MAWICDTCQVVNSLHRLIVLAVVFLWLMPSPASLALALHTALDHGDYGHHETRHGVHSLEAHRHEAHRHEPNQDQDDVDESTDSEILRWARIVSHGYNHDEVMDSDHQHPTPLSDSILSRPGPSPLSVQVQLPSDRIWRDRTVLSEPPSTCSSPLALFTRHCALLL